jgi:hypothetical protein
LPLKFLGNGDVQRIEQLGERLPLHPFSVLPEFAHLIAGQCHDLEPWQSW